MQRTAAFVAILALTGAALASLPGRKACPGCGSENTIYTLMCAECSADWNGPAEELDGSKPISQKCPGCGRPTFPDEFLCLDCGYSESYRIGAVSCPQCGSADCTYYEYACPKCGVTSQGPAVMDEDGRPMPVPCPDGLEDSCEEILSPSMLRCTGCGYCEPVE